MRSLSAFTVAAVAIGASASPLFPRQARNSPAKRAATGIDPKVFIIDAFPPEADAWYGIPEFDLLAHNITVPGFSPLYPDAHCSSDLSICQLVTGEAEINAASTVTALILSPVFDLRRTYFLIAGIAGVNPKLATLGSVAFARYEVQVALQYEFDPREIPDNFSTGYIPQGGVVPDEYPQSIYGTEVFELNDALRQRAMSFARAAALNDSATAAAYRALYAAAPGDLYAAGTGPPGVVACDGATSDVYFSGAYLGDAFANYTRLVTNGSGAYCMTLQEDSGTLEALLRGAYANRTDFARIIAMRAASDMDRPPPGVSAYQNQLYAAPGGFAPPLRNIYLAGVKVVQGIVAGWNATFEAGVNATNYYGDIFGTLGGTPDFGPYAFNNNPVLKRELVAENAKWRAQAGRRGRAVKGMGHMRMP